MYRHIIYIVALSLLIERLYDGIKGLLPSLHINLSTNMYLSRLLPVILWTPILLYLKVNIIDIIFILALSEIYHHLITVLYSWQETWISHMILSQMEIREKHLSLEYTTYSVARELGIDKNGVEIWKTPHPPT